MILISPKTIPNPLHNSLSLVWHRQRCFHSSDAFWEGRRQCVMCKWKSTGGIIICHDIIKHHHYHHHHLLCWYRHPGFSLRNWMELFSELLCWILEKPRSRYQSCASSVLEDSKLSCLIERIMRAGGAMAFSILVYRTKALNGALLFLLSHVEMGKVKPFCSARWEMGRRQTIRSVDFHLRRLRRILCDASLKLGCQVYWLWGSFSTESIHRA